MIEKYSRLLAGVLTVATTINAADFYVAPCGSDTNSGSLTQPFQTIQKAANVMAAGDTCLIRAGTYREAVTFPRNGTAGKPITIKPYRRERVTVSGCEPVTGWIMHSNHIWKAAMPWTLGLGRNQVFSGGQIMLEARYPNAPALGLELPVSGLSPLWPTYGEFTIPKETRVSQPGRILSALLAKQPDDYWKGALYCGVHFEGWCAQTGVIEGSKSGEIQVGDRTQGWWFGSAYDGKFPQEHEEGRGMIVGHLHALDAPGEWHWQDNTLYLIAPDGAEPKAVEAKRRQLAFDLSGREHIRIEGLAVQAASMRLEKSAHCVVDGCDLAYIAHYTRQYGIGQIEHGRDTIKSGETGIYVSGHDNAFLNCGVRFSAGTGFHIRGHHHTIHNCLIDEVSYVGHYLNAITDAVSDFGDYENLLVGGHVITFNTMRNAGRHFFNFNGNGTSLASRNRGPMDYAATLFAHNHLYNGMLLTRDAGFLTGYFGSGGTLNGLSSQVAFNVMHDCYDLSALRWNKLGMVYLDEGTCNVDVHNNLFWAAPGSLQRDMWFNTCCVGVSEYGNVFHGLFSRTCSKLREVDFPHGEPFRFGHDFAAPPSLPQWPWPPADALRLDLGTCSLHAERATSTLAGVAGLANGDWLAFDGVIFADGWRSAIIRFASAAKAMNTDRSARTAPRHRQATDPLVLEAKANDGASDKMRMQWTFFYNVDNSAWVRYERVPLGEGYRRIRAVYGNDRAEPWLMEVRLDRVDGPLVGSVDLPQTDRERGSHVQIYRAAEADLSTEATGTRDVYLVFRSKGGKPAVDFEYARFERYRGDLPLQKNEVKLELRAGDKDGPKLGEFYPRYTGGAESASEFVASIEDNPFVSGPLVLVVRSALSEPIGILSGVRLERSGNGGQWPGIGVPPRRRWWGLGGMILPEATHRPLPMLADRYGDSGALRPFYRATRFAEKPVIDGLLTEWTGRALELKQSREGVSVEEAAAHAWAGYDEEALYVALRAPLGHSKARGWAGHYWGDADGVELAFQNAESTPTGKIMTLRGWPDGRYSAPAVAGICEAARRRLEQAVTYRAAVGKDAWTGEWRIPLGVCGSPRALLKANLTVRNAGQDLWRTWNMVSGATYDLRNGGTLILGADDDMLSDRLKQGLEIWLDASDAQQIERDDAGAVSVWKDRSGKGRHAVQANPAFRPHFVAQGLNGKAALKFDDQKKTRLEAPDLSDRPMTATVFAVVSNPEPGLPQNSNSRVFTASDGKAYDYLCGISCNLPGTQTGGPRLLTFEGKDRWARRVRVGCFSPNDQTFLNGYVSEIQVFGRALTQEERYRVAAYLTGKWDL